MQEDPSRPALPAVFPDLGPDAPTDMLPIAGTIIPEWIWNEDVGRGSYAAYVARDVHLDGSDYTARSRSLGPCD